MQLLFSIYSHCVHVYNSPNHLLLSSLLSYYVVFKVLFPFCLVQRTILYLLYLSLLHLSSISLFASCCVYRCHCCDVLFFFHLSQGSGFLLSKYKVRRIKTKIWSCSHKHASFVLELSLLLGVILIAVQVRKQFSI